MTKKYIASFVAVIWLKEYCPAEACLTECKIESYFKDERFIRLLEPENLLYVIISEEVYMAMIDFQKQAQGKGIDVWFCITDY